MVFQHGFRHCFFCFLECYILRPPQHTAFSSQDAFEALRRDIDRALFSPDAWGVLCDLHVAQTDGYIMRLLTNREMQICASIIFGIMLQVTWLVEGPGCSPKFLMVTMLCCALEPLPQTTARCAWREPSYAVSLPGPKSGRDVFGTTCTFGPIRTVQTGGRNRLWGEGLGLCRPTSPWSRTTSLLRLHP